MNSMKADAATPKAPGNILRASLLFAFALLSSTALSCGGSESAAPGPSDQSNVAGKGGAKTAGTKAPDVDACSLLSRADAEAIMGKLKEAPKPVTSAADEKTCSYMNMSGANVTVRIYGADWYDVQKNLNDAEKIVSLAGLGEEAYYVKKSGAVDLWSRKGGASLYLNGTIGLEAEKRMATKILGRL